jgi:hypothetical protein
MLKKQITLTETIRFLNRALRFDPKGISVLFSIRTMVNKKIAEHPTIQVQMYKKEPRLSLLGLLNGLFGVDKKGYGGITAWVEGDGRITKFCKTKHKKGK